MSRPLTWRWRWLTGLTVLTLAGGFLVPYVARAPELQEKRALAEFPPWPWRAGELAGFRKGVDAYVGDRFPARPYLIGTLNALRMPFGVSGSDRVIVGRDGWLFYDNGSHLGAARNDPPMTQAQVRRWLQGLAGRTEAAERGGARYLVVVAPQKETIYPQMGPAWYRGPDPDRPGVALPRWARISGAGEVLDLHDAVARPTGWGLKTFSRHDTHWTGLGAYQGYAAMMATLQTMGFAEAARPLTDFAETRKAANEPRDLALMLGVSSFVRVDYPQFTDPPAAKQLRTTYLTANHSWTGAQVVETGRVGKPVVLIDRDSFSNALLPFLYGHFSRLILVHHQDGFWREDLIARFKPDLVILEVLEGGLPNSMLQAPPASAAARARIAAATARPLLPRANRLDAADFAEADARIVGGPDDDVLRGRRGNDTLEGMGGDDTAHGGRGRDEIHGGPGDDWLSGDRGDDVLWGDEGADVFHSFPAAGIDRVMDFSVAEGDRIELEPGNTYEIRQEGADTVIEIVGGGRLILVGIKASDLGPGTISLR
ncbi:MAG TPA: hypothetical protein VFW47_01380 [Phenylobacterium sp.]|nr:hypothetical protein [Phenylobacterium sp.]